MGIKISELTSGSSVNGDDQYPAVQGSSTKKFSPSQMASYVLNTFSSLSLGGVVRTVKAAIDAIATTVASHTTLLGDSTMGTTATTVTGAIAEHEGDITTLNSNLADVIRFQDLALVNTSISANASTTVSGDIPTAPEGFRFRGIQSVRFDGTGTTSSANVTFCVANNFWPDTSSGKAYASVRNFASTAAKVTTHLVCIYTRNSNQSR